MNEQAIQDSYNVFVKQGYTKSIDDYKQLIASNPEALQDSYNAFVNQGYGKSINDYKSLMGLSAAATEPLKKKRVKYYGITFGRYFFGFAKTTT